MATRSTVFVLHNLTRRTTAAARVTVPTRPMEWALGLLARPPLGSGEALWLPGCRGIHTWGMRYAIDVIFVDRECRVLRVVRGLSPWRLILWAPQGTDGVLEFPAGGAEAVTPGDRLKLEASTD